MQLIYAIHGQEIQVDDWNYEWLARFRWSVTVKGYAKRHEGRIRRVCYYMAREVLAHKLDRPLLPWPQEIADHEDLNKLNNQERNLRLATASQSVANRDNYFSSSTYKGVCWDGSREQWKAAISTGTGIRKSKRFSTELEAALWYDEQARLYHGEFARTNFNQEVV